MTEALAAVGIAASIIQLVDFGTRAIRRLVEYQAECREVPEAFAQIHAQLPLLIEALRQTQQELNGGYVTLELESTLGPNVDGCLAQLKQLDQILLAVAPLPANSRAVRVKKGLLSLRKESEVSKINSRLSGYISTLTFYFAWSSNSLTVRHHTSRVFDVLAVPDQCSTFQKALAQHQPDTCNWFLDGDAYSKWRCDPASIVWLHGGPGCGKTVLSAAIIDNLRRECEKDPAKSCAYYFFSFNDKAEQKPVNMVKSLICQLLDSCVELPSSLNSIARDSCSRLTEADLVSALKDTIVSLPTVYLVIDALDECDENRQDELTTLLHLFENWKLHHVHILITSRKEQTLTNALGKFIPAISRLAINSSHVDSDIGSYVRARLDRDERFRRWRHDQHIRAQIESALTSGAAGMFRWAACQMDDLASCLNRAMVLRSLKNLPRTLEETYDRILCSIDASYRPYARQVLRWLAFSNISLTVAQVSHITGFVDDETPRFDEDEVLPDPHDVLTICKSLVVVVEAPGIPYETSVVQLAHFTVKQYLTSDKAQQLTHASFYSMETQMTHTIIAKQCIAYMTKLGSEANNPLGARSRAGANGSEKFPLAAYALYEWRDHAKAASPDITVDIAALRFMCEPAAYFNCFLQFGKELSPHRKLATVLEEASTLGFTGVVRLILSMLPDNDESPSKQSPGAKLPVKHVEACLADLTTEAAAIESYALIRAIREAAHHENLDILDLLMSEKIDMDVAYSTVLMAAAMTGQAELLKWLQNRGFIWNQSLYSLCQEVVATASAYGFDDVVTILLDMGADVNAVGADGTALRSAVLKNRQSTVQLLLDRGAGVNICKNGPTPLYSAVDMRHKDLVAMLLEHGADVNIRGNRGPPVVLAAERPSGILELILENHPSLGAMGPEGTALHIASKHNRLDFVKMLIERGADVNAPGPDGTPLHMAAAHHRSEVVDVLISKGADVDVSGPSGTALQIAVFNGITSRPNLKLLIATIDSLRAAGADANLSGPHGSAFEIIARPKHRRTWGGQVVCQKQG